MSATTRRVRRMTKAQGRFTPISIRGALPPESASPTTQGALDSTSRLRQLVEGLSIGDLVGPSLSPLPTPALDAFEDLDRTADELAEQRTAQESARAAREQAMLDALQGIVSVLEEQRAGEMRTQAVTDTTAALAFLALIAGTVATVWTVSESWAWTAALCSGTVLVSAAVAWWLGVGRRSRSCLD